MARRGTKPRSTLELLRTQAHCSAPQKMFSMSSLRFVGASPASCLVSDTFPCSYFWLQNWRWKWDLFCAQKCPLPRKPTECMEKTLYNSDWTSICCRPRLFSFPRELMWSSHTHIPFSYVEWRLYHQLWYFLKHFDYLCELLTICVWFSKNWIRNK